MCVFPVPWLPTRQQLDFCSIHSPRASSSTFGLDRLGMDAEVEGVEVLLDRELGVLDPRGHRVGGAGGQLELGQAEQELVEGLVARGGVPRQLLELRPIVGSRSCRKWALSNSVVTSAIGTFLSHQGSGISRARRRAEASGADQAKKTLTGLSAAGPLRSWLKRLRSGSGTWTWGDRGRFGRRRRTAARRGLDRGERPRPLDDGLGAVEVLAQAGLDRPDARASGDARPAVAGPG